MNRRDVLSRRVLRWYPVRWRERYGEELVDLINDTHPRRVPLRVWWGIARAALTQHARAGGFWGRASSHSDRLRAGALSVLAAWTLVGAVACAFAKYSEHWDAVTPLANRMLPATALTIFQFAAFSVVLVCGVGAVVSGRSFLRLCRDEGLSRVTRLLRPLVGAGATATLSTAAMIAVAHHLNSAQRNGGLEGYRFAGLAWVALMLTCLGVALLGVARIVLRLTYSPGELRTMASLALSATGCMIVMFSSLLVWWAAMARHARWFFSSAAAGTAATRTPAALIVLAVMMALGLAGALWGSRRALISARAL